MNCIGLVFLLVARINSGQNFCLINCLKALESNERQAETGGTFTVERKELHLISSTFIELLSRVCAQSMKQARAQADRCNLTDARSWGVKLGAIRIPGN